MKLPRRKFLHLAAGATALPTVSRFAWAQSPPTSPGGAVRVTTGLLATWQSTAWLGAEAGLFKKRGIDMTLPAIAVGGPEVQPGSFAAIGSSPTPEPCLSRKKSSKVETSS